MSESTVSSPTATKGRPQIWRVFCRTGKNPNHVAEFWLDKVLDVTDPAFLERIQSHAGRLVAIAQQDALLSVYRVELSEDEYRTWREIYETRR
jgi:hypothetical protein